MASGGPTPRPATPRPAGSWSAPVGAVGQWARLENLASTYFDDGSTVV